MLWRPKSGAGGLITKIFGQVCANYDPFKSQKIGKDWTSLGTICYLLISRNDSLT